MLYIAVYYYWLPFLVFIFNWYLINSGTSIGDKNGVEIHEKHIKTQDDYRGWDPNGPVGGYAITYLENNKNMNCTSNRIGDWMWTWS